MAQELPNTPGPLGYILMLLTSAFVMPPLYPVPASMSTDGVTDAGLEEFVQLWAFAVPITLVVATPFAVLGIPVIHALCHRVPSQSAHIAVSGLVVFIEVFWLCLAFGDRTGGPAVAEWLALAGSAAGGAAAGRAVVIPIVLARRARASAGPAAGVSAAGRRG